MKKPFWPYELEGTNTFVIGRIQKFLDKIGNPERKLNNIFHIAGTNGKGSTTAYIKSILEAEKYSVNRFISPHLVDWNERIEIRGKQITDEYANELTFECKKFSEENNLPISWFEAVTVYAILAFIRNPADATILEVGLGGIFDATNVITNSLVSVITSISYDHTEILGKTIAEIAKNKAGIIKENGITIINKQKYKEAFDVLYDTAIKKNNKVYYYGKDWNIEKLKNSFIYRGFRRELELPLPYLKGDYQIDNASGSISAILAQDKLKISNNSIIEGLKNVRWNGRLQDISNEIKIKNIVPINSQVIIDGSHNEDGATTIRDWIYDEDKKKKKYNIFIFAILKRKDSVSYIKSLNKCFDMVITTQMILNDGSKNKDDLKEEFINEKWKNISTADNFISALNNIKDQYTNGENIRIVIGGSLYFIGEILEWLKK